MVSKNVRMVIKAEKLEKTKARKEVNVELLIVEYIKLDVHGQESGKNLDLDGQGVGGLENWTIFMDVICVSFLKRFV